ncbi:zinc-dependent metalloprotease [Streptomyces sp. NPDC057654]|uniref:zinc-dependent metalloprotease n=1 Tax=Streptomyces sp. NPDC057654 TaxID=3346196 RepID=UPI0036842FD9
MGWSTAAGSDFYRRQIQQSPTPLPEKQAQCDADAAFVGHIIEDIGLAAFNTVWESPSLIPTAEDFHTPDAHARYLRRTPHIKLTATRARPVACPYAGPEPAR